MATKKYEDSPLDQKMDKTMQKVMSEKGAARKQDAAKAIGAIKKVASAGPKVQRKGR